MQCRASIQSRSILSSKGRRRAFRLDFEHPRFAIEFEALQRAGILAVKHRKLRVASPPRDEVEAYVRDMRATVKASKICSMLSLQRAFPMQSVSPTRSCNMAPMPSQCQPVLLRPS